MKKIYLISIISLSAIIGIASCQDAETEEKSSQVVNDKSSNNLKMIQELANFNESLESTTRAIIHSRFDDSELIKTSNGRWVRVALADALGGLIGGFLSGGSGTAVGAVFASAAFAFNGEQVAAKTEIFSERKFQLSYLDTVTFAVFKAEKIEATTRASINSSSRISFSQIPAAFEEKATYRATIHNKALEILQTNDLSDFAEIDTTFFSDSSFETKCSEYVNYISEGKDLPVVEGNEIEILVFNLFKEAFATVNDQEDIQEIINAYASIIEKNTTLTATSKEYIYESLVISAYSYDYWSNLTK